ncbi:hypothetical protein ACFSGX_14070 [Sphingomonas arantia]|uniref:Uncharacterized protein n=1 Tax=Sphingomonas arantia TaxID=1460676 RepID=A0ABW4U3U2_9SPHN
MTPADGPFGRFHREVDRDRPACGAVLSWRVTIGVTILMVLLTGVVS